MKKQIIVLALCFIVSVFAACTDSSQLQRSDIDESASFDTESSAIVSENETSDESEEKKEWTEVEEIGNEKITREYRDGKNDYTVTAEAFYDDGMLSQKIITDYINEIAVKMRKEVYEKDGSYLFTIEDNDSDGKLQKMQLIKFGGSYVRSATFDYTDETEGSVAKVEFSKPDKTVVATGTSTTEMFNGVRCSVEKLDIIENDAVVRRQIIATDVSGTYVYMEIVDLDGNKILFKEVKDGSVTECLTGAEGIKIVVEGTKVTYYDSNGKYIAVCEGTTIVSVASEYAQIDVAQLINTRLAKMVEAFKLVISLA